MKKKGFKSIRLEMVFYIFTITVVICAAFFGISTTRSQLAVSELLEDSLTQIASEASVTISNRVSAIQEQLQIIATHELFLDGEVGKHRMTSYFNKMQTLADGDMELAYAEQDGIAYMTGDRQENVAETENFLRGMAGESYVSDPAPIGADGEMRMTFSVPVYNRDGEVRGVLMRFCDGYELNDIITDHVLGQSGYAFIVNKDGVIVAHPNREMVAAQEPILATMLADPEGADFADLLTRMVEGNTGAHEYIYGGVHKNAGYAPIAGTDWFLALTAPHEEMFAVTDQLQMVLLIATVALALLSAVCALLIANRIHKPIRNLEKTAEKFSEGNLDVAINVRRRDEIGKLAQALNTVADNMTRIISGIRAGAEQVAAESKGIADSGQQFAQGTTEQASALEEITASVEQIAAQTRTNAVNAVEANQLAASTRSMAESGNGKMSSLLGAMKDINHSSNDIVRVIKVIDDIAFQTNILALNAAIEAAHAGQHGKGFAVVAQEVRTLAAKSAEAAQETANLIDDSNKKVIGGVRLAEETADELNKIVKEVSRVAALVSDISVASGEQSTGIEQINQGLLQVSQVVQANSAASQLSAAASQHLTAQADLLSRQVAGFQLRGASAPALDQGAAYEGTDVSGRKKQKKRARKEKGGAESSRFGEGTKAQPTEALRREGALPEKPPMPAYISLDAESEQHAQTTRPPKVALSDREFGKY